MRGRPGAGAAAQAFEKRTGIKAPRIIAWEITRSCNLACAHCRASAHCEPYPGELTFEECRRLIDDIASITDPILILTGGEPLMRADIWDIVDYAREKGLRPVIGTNGTLIDDECAAAMAAHGIPRVSVSLDFPTPEGQDAFRGKPGAFAEAITGMRNLRAHCVEVQVNMTVTRMNNHLVDDVHNLAIDEGAVAFHPFLLVPTGRGEDLMDVELSPEEYEEVLTWAYHCQKTSPLHFKPTDAPQYYRIIRQQSKLEGRTVNRETYGMEAMTRGCLGGVTFAFISHVGDVQPCGYFNMQLGNVKDTPFSKIWETSPVFDDLRHYDRLRGKCGACEYKGVCGGCRARALAVTGDYLAEEPYCAYVPPAVARQRVLDEIQSNFPLEHDPYGVLGKRLGLSREQVLDAIDSLRSDGSIRQIAASLQSRKLGYVSTLFAIAVDGDQDQIDRAGALVSAHPEITHNYQRTAEYNVWFTAIAPTRDDLEQLQAAIASETGCEVINLPVESLYKIRVDFGKHGKRAGSSTQAKTPESAAVTPNPAAEAPGRLPTASADTTVDAPAASPAATPEALSTSPAAIGATCPRATAPETPAVAATTTPEAPAIRPFDASDPFDVALVHWAQADVIGEYPFQDGAAQIAAETGDDSVDESRVIQRLNELKACGVIRRFGAFVHHLKLGYTFNGMAVWIAPNDCVDELGTRFAALPYVSHCYRRTTAPSWPYNLYVMVHATSQAELDIYVDEMKKLSGLEPRVLVSTKEFKKALPIYFGTKG